MEEGAGGGGGAHVVVDRVPLGVVNSFGHNVCHLLRAETKLHQRLFEAHAPHELGDKIQLAGAGLHFRQPRHHARFTERVQLQLGFRLRGF